MEVLVMPEIEVTLELDCIDINTAIISIFPPKSKKIDFTTNPFINGQFCMFFFDMDIGESHHTGIKAATQKNFNGLKDFVDDMSKEVEQFIVHCNGGISRSAGVGAAICEYLEVEDNIWKNNIYHPNLLVYKLACNELGMPKTVEDLDEKFTLRRKYSMFHDKNLDIYFDRYKKRNAKTL